jgi:hexulose-6-phosphate isomerase
MIKSINTWVFRSDRSAADVLGSCLRHRFDAVELTVDETGFLTLDSTEHECRELAGLLRAFGIRLSSLASGVGWKYPITAPDRSIAAKGVEAIKRSMQIAKWLGTDTLLVVPGGVGADFIAGFQGTTYDSAYRKALAELLALKPFAEEIGITLAIENVWNKFLLSPLEFRDFLDAVDSPYVKAYFDVGNVVLTGYPEQWIRILGPRIARVHFKDFKRSLGTLDGFCPLLEGDVDFPAVMNALAGVGYDGPVTAEYIDAEDQLSAISSAMDHILGR